MTGKQIRRLRRALDLSQERLAELAGITHQRYVSCAEHDIDSLCPAYARASIIATLERLAKESPEPLDHLLPSSAA